MSQVQQPPFASFVRVPAGYSGLYPCGGSDEFRQVSVLLQALHRPVVPTSGIVDDESLQQFGSSGSKMSGREGFQDLWTDECHLRLPYRPDHILVGIEIDSVLSADGSIDLGKEGGRDEAETDPALVDRCREACDVCRDTSSDSEQERIPACIVPHQPAADILHRGEDFVPFGCLDFQGSRGGDPGSPHHAPDIPVIYNEYAPVRRKLPRDILHRASDYLDINHLFVTN